MIQPEKIPQFTGNLPQLETDYADLKKDATHVRSTGADVHSQFQGLSAYYTAPEAEQLFATTKPVKERADDFATDLETVSGALSSYATEVQPLVTKLEELKAKATTFVDSVKDDDDWEYDGDKVDEHNQIRDDITATVAAFWAAERTCHNTITALWGGTQMVAGDGSDRKDQYGFNADDLKDAKLPWGDPVEEKHHWYEVGHWVKSFVWDGLIVDGIWGTIKGLGTLVGFGGWDAMGQAWKGLAQLATGLAISSIPGLGTAFWALPDDKLPSWIRDSRTAMKETGKALVAWDEWGKNPGRAAGAVTFNVLTTVFTGGAGGAAAGAGKAGAVAKVLSVAGKAGKVIDPMTYIAKGAGAGLSKIGDIAKGLKGVGTIDIPTLPEGAFTLPEGAVKLPDGTAAPARGHGDPGGRDASCPTATSSSRTTPRSCRRARRSCRAWRGLRPSTWTGTATSSTTTATSSTPSTTHPRMWWTGRHRAARRRARTRRGWIPRSRNRRWWARAPIPPDQAGQSVKLGNSLDTNLGDVGRVPDNAAVDVGGDSVPTVHAGGDGVSGGHAGDQLPGGTAEHLPGGRADDVAQGPTASHEPPSNHTSGSDTPQPHHGSSPHEPKPQDGHAPGREHGTDIASASFPDHSLPSSGHADDWPHGAGADDQFDADRSDPDHHAEARPQGTMLDPQPDWYGRSADNMRHYRRPALDVSHLTPDEQLAVLMDESATLADDARTAASGEAPPGNNHLDSGCAGSLLHDNVITAHSSTTKMHGQKLPRTHNVVENILKQVQDEAVTAGRKTGIGHGKCAEVSLISDRLHQLDPSGTKIRTADEARNALEGGAMHTRQIGDLYDRKTGALVRAHGEFLAPCNTCKHVLPQLGIHVAS